jgi:hypothetical protein
MEVTIKIRVWDLYFVELLELWRNLLFWIFFIWLWIATYLHNYKNISDYPDKYQETFQFFTFIEMGIFSILFSTIFFVVTFVLLGLYLYLVTTKKLLIEIDESGLKEVNKHKTILRNWNDVKRIKKIPGYFVIKIRKRRNLILPLRYFNSKDDANNFFSFAKNKIGYNNPILRSRNRPANL